MGTTLKSKVSFNSLLLAFDRSDPSALEYSVYGVWHCPIHVCS